MIFWHCEVIILALFLQNSMIKAKQLQGIENPSMRFWKATISQSRQYQNRWHGTEASLSFTHIGKYLCKYTISCNSILAISYLSFWDKSQDVTYYTVVNFVKSERNQTVSLCFIILFIYLIYTASHFARSDPGWCTTIR